MYFGIFLNKRFLGIINTLIAINALKIFFLLSLKFSFQKIGTTCRAVCKFIQQSPSNFSYKKYVYVRLLFIIQIVYIFEGNANRGTAQCACGSSKGLSPSYLRKREEPLDVLDEDDCFGRW